MMNHLAENARAEAAYWRNEGHLGMASKFAGLADEIDRLEALVDRAGRFDMWHASYDGQLGFYVISTSEYDRWLSDAGWVYVETTSDGPD